jgi:hypothetical protein
MDEDKKIKSKAVELEALARALKALGPDKLSVRLNAPPELIQTWLNGHATVPQRKFMLLIDILGEINEAGPS